MRVQKGQHRACEDPYLDFQLHTLSLPSMFGVVASLACLATLSAASPLVSTSPSKAIYTSLESLSNARKSFVTDPTIARLVDERIVTLTPFELLAMQGSSLAKAAAPVAALSQKAHEQQIKWQPSMDFDTDGCYNVPAVNAQGATTAGLPHNFVSASSDCRDASDLDNNNVYVRSRCNNGYCVHIYDYYFEKDVAVRWKTLLCYRRPHTYVLAAPTGTKLH